VFFCTTHICHQASAEDRAEAQQALAKFDMLADDDSRKRYPTQIVHHAACMCSFMEQ